MPARGNRSAIALGPGWLYGAPLGTAEPTYTLADLAAPTTPWVLFGYSAEGTTQSYELSTDPIQVAEEVDPLDTVTTGREINVGFSMAEVTLANFKTAFNGGTLATTGTSPNQVQTYEPPVLGAEVAIMLIFLAEDLKEKWLYRQVKQIGSVETGRKKGADKALIPLSFKAFAPSTGLAPFKVLGNRGLELMAITKKAGRHSRKKEPVEMTLDYDVDVTRPAPAVQTDRTTGEKVAGTVTHTVTEHRSETFMLRGEITTLALAELAAHAHLSSTSSLGALIVRQIFQQAFGDEAEYERFYRFAAEHLDDEDLVDLLSDVTTEFGARPTRPSSGSSGTPAPDTSGDASRGASSPEDGAAASNA